jgi:glyoxylase-like metal-dependent hydrolase (beta-lactamase superfamily II)
MGNNTYLLVDRPAGQGILIDPSFNAEKLLPVFKEMDVTISSIWYTHAHFDHIAGAGIARKLDPEPEIVLHSADLPLWVVNGGAIDFNIEIDPGPKPTIFVKHQQELSVGTIKAEVRHTPGHTPGHVVFFIREFDVVFTGDLLFKGSIGRTDLTGGDYQALMRSIHEQILTLPPHTRVLPGHGPETTVQAEKESNPFLK